MESRIRLPAVALVFALAFTSGDALKCYECKSVGSADDACSSEMLKSVSHMPVECSLQTMQSWYNKIHIDTRLTSMANVFEVSTPYQNKEMNYQYQDPHTPMACVKMELKVHNEPVTLRTCQTAKTADVDPCRAIREKIKHMGASSLTYCGMCETDNCNGSYALSPTMILAIVPLIGSILMSLVQSSA